MIGIDRSSGSADMSLLLGAKQSRDQGRSE
jgi:hypothetical protein